MSALCLLLCACNPMTATQPTPGAVLPTANATLAPTVAPTLEPTPEPTLVPTAEPTPMPTRQPFENWDIEDNGIDGIGTIRGNTNGNLANGGRAVDVGDVIYYVESTSNTTKRQEGKMQLFLRSKMEGAAPILLDERACIEGLNWDGKQLWYAYSDSASSLPDRVRRLDPSTGETHIVGKERAYVSRLLIAYGMVFVSRGYGYGGEAETTCLDINTLETVYVHEDFIVTSAMDGWLYGCDGYLELISDKFYKMRPDGTEKKKSAPVSVAADGQLYFYDLQKPGKDGFPLSSSEKLLVTDARSGKMRKLGFKDVFGKHFNVSHELIYLTEYDDGNVYTVNLDGKKLTRLTGYNYYWAYALTIIDGKVL